MSSDNAPQLIIERNQALERAERAEKECAKWKHEVEELRYELDRLYESIMKLRP